MSDNPSAVPIERPQYNSAQTVQVSIVDDCFDCSISYTSIQGFGGLDHELGSNEYLLGISSAASYPAASMNHANAFPPARYSSAMPAGYDVPPYLATVGVHLPIFTPLR
jgi:hypothetical protein